MNDFIILEPKPYDRVNGKFLVRGSIPIHLLREVQGFSHRLLLNLLDVHGRIIMGSSVDISLPTRTGDPNQIIYFSFPFEIHEQSHWSINKSEGRMAIHLSVNRGNFDTKPIEVFLPIIFIIPQPEKGFNQQLINKHQTLESRVKQYRIDSVKYAEELKKITLRRQNFFELAKQNSVEHEVIDKFAEDLSYAIDSIDTDEEIKQLNEKYKESLEWSGPLLHGVVGWLRGFSFQVYSNDHGKHFHVIHKEKEIDARFSFPEIKLISYKGRSKELNSKTIKIIQDYFMVPENFQRLELALANQVNY